jgi:hypothetical protein
MMGKYRFTKRESTNTIDVWQRGKSAVGLREKHLAKYCLLFCKINKPP